MTDQKFLRIARARDDENFVMRISAAAQMKAQYQAEFDLSPASRALTDWVLEHPMEEVPRLVAFVSTNGTVVNNIAIVNNTIDTSAVPDSDIEYVVGDRWDVVAKLMFPQVAV
jgi:hypothetical protein